MAVFVDFANYQFDAGQVCGTYLGKRHVNSFKKTCEISNWFPHLISSSGISYSGNDMGNPSSKETKWFSLFHCPCRKLRERN